jgi:hypothetical protein
MSSNTVVSRKPQQTFGLAKVIVVLICWYIKIFEVYDNVV